MSTTTLSSKYQIVIPKAVRAQLGLQVGESVSVHLLDSESAILTKHSANPTNALRGLGKDVWKKLGGTKKYMRQERSSWK